MSEALALVGRYVLLDALVSRGDLNGLVGKCEAFDAPSGRLAVRLSTSPQKPPMLIKAQNVIALSDAVSELACACASEHKNEVVERARAARSGQLHDDCQRVVLDLESTGLEQLPSSIGTLGLVVELWLGDNRLTSLPIAVASLNSLRALGRLAVRPPLEILALRPCRWWNLLFAI